MDEDWVFAAGVTAGIDGALRLAAELRDVEVTQAVQLTMAYVPEPPFDNGASQTRECQRSCRAVLVTACACPRVVSVWAAAVWTMMSRSGSSVTAPMGVQLRVCRLQRPGLLSCAALVKRVAPGEQGPILPGMALCGGDVADAAMPVLMALPMSEAHGPVPGRSRRGSPSSAPSRHTSSRAARGRTAPWGASTARFRDELLACEAFNTLAKAKVLIERWRAHTNTVRPHSAPRYRPAAPDVIVSRAPVPAVPPGPAGSAAALSITMN